MDLCSELLVFRFDMMDIIGDFSQLWMGTSEVQIERE